MTKYLSNQKFQYFKQKHASILSAVTFSKETPWYSTFEQAVSNSIHKVVLNMKNKKPKNTPHHTFVDDKHFADILPRMKQAMAASIEAIFIVFGYYAKDNTRRSSLSLDKYYHAKCSWKNYNWEALLINAA